MRPIDIVLRDFEKLKDRVQDALDNSKNEKRLLDEHISLPLLNLQESANLALSYQKRGIMKPCHVTCMALDVAELSTAVEVGEEIIGRKRFT